MILSTRRGALQLPGNYSTLIDTVQLKSLASHERKALLITRHQLADMRVRIDNQLRGILKTFGLVIGKCSRGQLGHVRRSCPRDARAQRALSSPWWRCATACSSRSPPVIDGPKRFAYSRNVGANEWQVILLP